MPNPQLSIVIVDDARFSSAMISRVLQKAGYQDIRCANNAAAALKLLKERPAGVLLVDWMMPETSGLELTAQVRQYDEQQGHYTYIILLTGKEGDAALNEAFNSSIDDFINKAAMSEQLVPRILAADRLYNTLARMFKEKQLLTRNIASFKSYNQVDPLTGLGNARYLKQRLEKSLQHVAARGGTLYYVLAGIDNMQPLIEQHGRTAHKELLRGIAGHLQQLVRPLDVLTRLDGNHFALLAHSADQRESSPNSFKRLYDGLNLKSFQTRAGFISLSAGISLISLTQHSLPIDSEHLIHLAAQQLPHSYRKRDMVSLHLNAPGPL